MNITIDPSNANDCELALKFILQQPNMKQYADIFNQSQRNGTNLGTENTKQSTDEISELKKEIDRQHKKITENNEKILFLKKENDDYKLKIHTCEEREKELRDTISKNETEHKSEIKKCKDECSSSLETTRREKEKLIREIDSKEQEINKLKKLLESYSVSFGSDDPNEKIFFEVSEEGHLTETCIESDSLYYACKTDEHYRYSINTENGPIKKACDNIELYLAPYCEIVDSVNDANFIQMIKVGTAKFHNTKFEVIQKVKIKLIKQ